jgi:L-histidine N-alpha-methyltransferase
MNMTMPAAAHVLIDPSQFPENVRRDLLASLRLRQINPKFHYDSLKQTRRWLALHQQHSPSRTDDACTAIYNEGFAAVIARLTRPTVHLIGLGCGGGQKDTRLLKLLQNDGRNLRYTPCDVSAAMVLVARTAALNVLGEQDCFPTVCDLATTADPANLLLRSTPPAAQRVFTFFGMIPNFEPGGILPKLAQLVGPADSLLFSANLAPGNDYEAGVRKILSQYDNPLTREWLLTFLMDLGLEPADGHLDFGVESGEAGVDLKRVVAIYTFDRKVQVRVDDEVFRFEPQDTLRLFFSYRYTPERLKQVLLPHGFRVDQEWITPSQEEGVFLLSRS